MLLIQPFYLSPTLLFFIIQQLLEGLRRKFPTIPCPLPWSLRGNKKDQDRTRPFPGNQLLVIWDGGQSQHFIFGHIEK